MIGNALLVLVRTFAVYPGLRSTHPGLLRDGLSALGTLSAEITAFGETGARIFENSHQCGVIEVCEITSCAPAGALPQKTTIPGVALRCTPGYRLAGPPGQIPATGRFSFFRATGSVG